MCGAVWLWLEQVVRFWGEVHFAKGEWVGVEFDEENLGDHDSIVQGVRYFQARPKSALFVRPPQVMVKSFENLALVLFSFGCRRVE